MVDRPLKELQAGTQKLSEGGLGHQIELHSNDQIGDLAESFNTMSLQLRAANEELVSWGRTLEERVEQKTSELRRAHDEVLHVETMASVGKMAAVVAHEINNPLSGILTYSKLIKKWVDKDLVGKEKKEEAQQCLDLISSESRRCGDLVKNLLTFSRQSPMNVQPTDINHVVEQCTMLLRPNLKIAAVDVAHDSGHRITAPALRSFPDRAGVARRNRQRRRRMPKGGNLWIDSRLSEDGSHVFLTVRDDGSGIPPEVTPKIFEPFVTTKENGHGTGLGLAVSRGIVERHSGKISVESEVGKGTTVTITLPVPDRFGPKPEPVLAGADDNKR